MFGKHAVLLVLAAVFLIAGHVAIELAMRASIRTETTSTAREKAIFLNAMFETAASGIEAILDDTAERLSGVTDPLEAQVILQNPATPEALVQLAAIAPDGWLLASSLAMQGPVDLSDREHFKVHRDARVGPSELFISAPVLGRVSGLWTIQFTKAVRDPAGGFAGVVVASYAATAFTDFYSRFPVDEGFLISLVGLDGVVRARAVKGGEDLFGIMVPAEELHAAILRDGSRPVAFTSPRDGLFRVGWAEVSSHHPVYILVGKPMAGSILAAWTYHLSWLLLVAGLGGIGIMAGQRFENAMLQEQLETSRRTAEVARLVSLGELAAGLGHEISTPAGTIMQAVENLSRTLEDGRATPEVIRSKLARIAANAVRIRDLMEAVRGHARQSPCRGSCEPARAVENALLLVGSQIQYDEVETRARILPCGRVACASPDLETVVINLLLNARDAVQANAPERRLIQISCAPFENEARIVVEDAGGGVPATIQNKIFQPFFTTKPLGKGTGIGLSTAMRIVNAAEGTIGVENTAKGARFTVRLPLLDPSSPAVAATSDADNPEAVAESAPPATA
jgi:two-component system, NtrC family, sensor kinase